MFDRDELLEYVEIFDGTPAGRVYEAALKEIERLSRQNEEMLLTVLALVKE